MIITVNIPKRSYVTNGDVIKALFNGQYGTNGDYVHVFGVGGNGCLVFTKEWWNAKYTSPKYDEEQNCGGCIGNEHGTYCMGCIRAEFPYLSDNYEPKEGD